MRRILGLLLLAAVAGVGLTACMGDDEGSAREQRRAAALVQSAGGSADMELTIAGLTPAGVAIQVDSFSWGLTNSAGAAARFDELHIVKKLDETSPLLYKGAALGTAYASAALKLYKVPAGGKPVSYATYDLTNVLITRVEYGGGGNAVPSEQVSLNFQAMKLTSAALNVDGTLGAPVSFGYDAATGKAG